MPEKKTTTKAVATAAPAKRAAAKTAAPKAEKPAAKVVAKAPAGRPVSAKAAAAMPKPAATPKRVVRKRAPAPVPATATGGPAKSRAQRAWRKGTRKTKVGLVVSAKQALTVIVQVERLREHPLYRKVIRVRKRFAAHDGAGDVRAGDLVRIEEGRPYSATKRWRVVEVLSRAGEAGAAAPKVTDIEAALEATEGSKDALAPAVLSPAIAMAPEEAHE